MPIKRDRCIPIDERFDSLVNAVETLDPSSSLTAGCGIIIAGSVVSAAVDGITMICEGGVLKAVAASDLVEGCGITIAFGFISVKTDDTTMICDSGGLVCTSQAYRFIAVAGQTTIQADSFAETLTVEGTGGIAITTNNTTKKLTIDGSGVSGGGGSGSANVVQGTLKTDLTVAMTTVNIEVTRTTDAGVVAVGATLSVANPDDNLAVGPRQQHAGNFDAGCQATQYATGWALDWVQPPVARPVHP